MASGGPDVKVEHDTDVKLEAASPAPAELLDVKPCGRSGMPSHSSADQLYAGRSQENNNSICQTAHDMTPHMSHYPEGGYVMQNMNEGSSLSTHLHSAFNLLDSDPSQQGWSYANAEDKKAMYVDRSQVYYEQQQQMNNYPRYMDGGMVQCSIPPIEKSACGMDSDYGSYEPAEKRRKSTTASCGQSAKQFQQEYTENFRRFINIPSTSSLSSAPATNTSADSGVQSPDSDDAESVGSVNGGSVMCPACKGVYPSPRSLTGHIGRTEKCREAIGRDYIEDIMRRGESVCIPDAATAGDGISPVCPNCNRFISHYKGNIRRHMVGCKRGSAQRKPSDASEPMYSSSSANSFDTMSGSSVCGMSVDDSLLQPSSSMAGPSMPLMGRMGDGQIIQELQPIHGQHQAYPPMYHQPMMHQMPHHFAHPEDPQQPMMGQIPMNPGYTDYIPGYESTMPPHQQYQQVYNIPSTPEMMGPSPAMTSMSAESSIQKPRPPKHNGMVTPDDPYICSWCAFNTVYKGNMKRHLISCHNCNDELLRKYNFELERLRKSAALRAGPESLPFIEIRPPQPPGTKRARNANANNKNMGRPKKADKQQLDHKTLPSLQQLHEQPPLHRLPQQAYCDPGMVHYGVVPPAQSMDSYEMQMQFMGAPAPVLHAPNSFMLKDCGNDSGLSMGSDDAMVGVQGFDGMHQIPPLPGY